jgi:predicted Zn-ribbon and HTH transcriptional regulator
MDKGRYAAIRKEKGSMSFKTEFKFTLPKGYVDKEGRVHREGTMRLATAKDEIAPLQDFRVQANRAYLVIILLSRVVTRLGTIEMVNPGVIEEFFSSDLAYLQDLYRRVNEEGSAMLPARCPSCGHDFEVDMGAPVGES